jgi:hypothetical protein
MVQSIAERDGVPFEGFISLPFGRLSLHPTPFKGEALSDGEGAVLASRWAGEEASTGGSNIG